ncbi:tRNA (guanine(9)-N(1))-methyltransferase [Besnoitia besnoiti]|uniref:tRNA (guanine(9)-N(1))-methyltransferase n=1 Tax=Besnoitia besnoiti TaxID=94643 RepID=A0A2A9MAA9_BESBE|nr:tRNA (guanine(9)-N(1))-methyltransferase [Besnoitia besnoiti]PFH34134.1 tRNA (guanine(9)-N(1))-methyltransferase [Besnoitia besnoiti]
MAEDLSSVATNSEEFPAEARGGNRSPAAARAPESPSNEEASRSEASACWPGGNIDASACRGALSSPADELTTAAMVCPPHGSPESKNQMRKRRRQERHEQRKQLWKEKKKELRANKRVQRPTSGASEEAALIDSSRLVTSRDECCSANCGDARGHGREASSVASHSTCHGDPCVDQTAQRRAPRPLLCNLAGVQSPGSDGCCCSDSPSKCASSMPHASKAGPSTPPAAHSGAGERDSSRATSLFLKSTAGSRCTRCRACRRGSVGIVIDCDFEDFQTEREIMSLSQQLMYSYGAARRHNKTVQCLLDSGEAAGLCSCEAPKGNGTRESDAGRDQAAAEEQNPLSDAPDHDDGVGAAAACEPLRAEAAQGAHMPSSGQADDERQGREKTAQLLNGAAPASPREDAASTEVGEAARSAREAAQAPLPRERSASAAADAAGASEDGPGVCQFCGRRKKVPPVGFAVTGVGPQLAHHLSNFQGFERWQCEAYTQPFNELYAPQGAGVGAAVRGSAASGSEGRETKAEASHAGQTEEAGNPGSKCLREPNIVYLSGDAEDLLEDIRPGCHYVIGGLVDRNRHKGLTARKGNRENIPIARLPIREYLGRKLDGCAILTVNQVVDILLGYLATRDWHAALVRAFPARKGRSDF